MPVEAITRPAVPAEPTTSPRLGHIRGLDGLRAVAVLSVLLAHMGWVIAPGGYLGVDVFFVLSGFLITSLLLREHDQTGRVSFRNFYARRALRLYPALLGALALALVTVGVAGYDSVRAWAHSALFSGLYVMDIVRAIHPHAEYGALGVTWSLAIEEHFYLLWPVVLVAALNRGVRRRTIGAVTAAATLFSLVAMEILTATAGDPSGLYYRADLRSGALLLGCVLALAGNRLPRRSLRLSVYPAVALLAVLIQFGPHNMTKASLTYAMPLTWAASAVIIAAVASLDTHPVKALLSIRPLEYVGKISYGVYLYQMVVLIWLSHRFAHLRFSESLLLGFVLPIIVAAVSFHAIERPALRLKRAFVR